MAPAAAAATMMFAFGSADRMRVTNSAIVPPANEVLNEVNVSAPVYSTAIVANNTLYLASQTHLFAIAEGAKPVEPKEKK